MRKSLFGFLSAAALAAAAMVPCRDASAQAPGIQFQGVSRARFAVKGSAVKSKVSIPGIVNLYYQDIPVKIVLVLSKKKYQVGRSVQGYPAASTQGVLPARTHVTNINFAGRTALPAGKYKAMVLVVGPYGILTGLNFKGTLKIGGASRAAASAAADAGAAIYAQDAAQLAAVEGLK